jgi:hypothetical protein
MPQWIRAALVVGTWALCVLAAPELPARERLRTLSSQGFVFIDNAGQLSFGCERETANAQRRLLAAVNAYVRIERRLSWLGSLPVVERREFYIALMPYDGSIPPHRAKAFAYGPVTRCPGFRAIWPDYAGQNQVSTFGGWACVAQGTLYWAGLWLATIGARPLWRAVFLRVIERRAGKGLCTRCGYAIQGLEQCPECGMGASNGRAQPAHSA